MGRTAVVDRRGGLLTEAMSRPTLNQNHSLIEGNQEETT